jgi:hypothetical protein
MNLHNASESVASLPCESDFVCVRGERVALDALLDKRLSDTAHIATLRESFRSARPFEHLVVDDWFSPKLLQLAESEFEAFPSDSWRGINSKYETTFRSKPGSALGPAATAYFNLVNSARFVSLLSQITGIEDIVTDPYLYGGGLHESRNGGSFGIHRDFDRHVRTGLQNEMVLLTYLNPTFSADWNGDLELWDAQKRECVAAVSPLFGRSILLRHSLVSFHGHPRPLAMPDGVVRRSMATYYYTNPQAREWREKRVSSVFMFSDRADTLREVGKRWTPPILWDLLARLVRR